MATKRPKTLSPEQLAAVSADEPRLVVRASAGTGKTTTLVGRYLRHVAADGMRPDQILTITFTRKAAAEMKERIVDALLELGMRDEAQIAETGPIQTIHGFCERILRECSVDAGLDPDFSILDETETSRRLIAAIRGAIGDIGEEPLIRELTRQLAGRRRFRGIGAHSLLEGAVDDVLRKLRGSTATLSELRRNYADPDQVALYWREQIVDKLPTAVREALAAIEPGHPFGVRLNLAFKAAKVKMPVRLPNPNTAEEAAIAETEAARGTCGLIRLAALAWERFEAVNRAESALDFVELERQTVELLQNSEPALKRVRSQYRVALVDESQDMNPIQHALLDALQIDTEMLVGDAQQSIYGFRQADVRLFEAKASRAEVKQLSENRRSDQGILRFVDALFSQVWEGNYVPMARGEAPVGAEFEGVEAWIQKAKDAGQVAEWVREVADQEGAKNVAVLVRGIAYAQDLFARLQAAGVPARIAGGTERYYTRLEVRDLANALDALIDPRKDFSLLALLRSPIVGLSLDAIVLLTGGGVWNKIVPGESPAEVEALEPLGPSTPDRVLSEIPEDDQRKLEHFRAWFEPLHAYADRVPAWELLSTVLAQTPYLSTLATRTGGVQTIANVRKLLAIAAGMPEAPATEFSRRLREIQEIRHHEGDAPASDDETNQVTILTVHKAKGLEFPVVVVPDMHGKARNAQEVEIDRSGMVTVKFGKVDSAYHTFNVLWRKDRDRDELYRILYVALTRAERRLCLVLNPGGPTVTLAGDIPDRLGWNEGIPEGVLVRRGLSVASDGDSGEEPPQ